MSEEYYCPKSCESQGDKCHWQIKPKLSSEPVDAISLNYCPFFKPPQSEQDVCPRCNGAGIISNMPISITPKHDILGIPFSQGGIPNVGAYSELYSRKDRRINRDKGDKPNA